MNFNAPPPVRTIGILMLASALLNPVTNAAAQGAYASPRDTISVTPKTASAPQFASLTLAPSDLAASVAAAKSPDCEFDRAGPRNTIRRCR